MTDKSQVSDYPDYDVMDVVMRLLDKTHDYKGSAAAMQFAEHQLTLARIQAREPVEDEKILAFKAMVGSNVAASILATDKLRARIENRTAVQKALDRAGLAGATPDQIAQTLSTLAEKTIRLKQGPPDVIDQAIEAIRRAATELAKTHGDQDVATYLQSVARQMSPAQGRAPVGLADDETVVQKATRPRDGFMAAIDAVMNGDFEPTDLRPSGR